MKSANHKKKQWSCWVLSEEDIITQAKDMGLSRAELKELDMDEVARRFRKGLESVIGDWPEWLEEAIADVLDMHKSKKGVKP